MYLIILNPGFKFYNSNITTNCIVTRTIVKYPDSIVLLWDVHIHKGLVTNLFDCLIQ